MYSCAHSSQRCRGWRPRPGFRDRKGDHTWFSSVRSVQAAQASSEVVVPKADSLVAFLSIGWIVFWERSFLCQRCGALTEQEEAFRRSCKAEARHEAGTTLVPTQPAGGSRRSCRENKGMRMALPGDRCSNRIPGDDQPMFPRPILCLSGVA